MEESTIILDSQDLAVLPKVPEQCGLHHHCVQVSDQLCRLEDKEWTLRTKSVFTSHGGNVAKISAPL